MTRRHALTLAPILACAAALALLVVVPAAHDAGDSPGGAGTATPYDVPAAGREEEPEPWEPRTASLVMGGDLLWHSPTWYSAQADHARTGRGRSYDFHPMFEAIHELVSGADLAICHEEVPFAAPGAMPTSYPIFSAPPQIVPWLKAFGFDACTTASNHSVDQGWEGLERTADLLDRHGIPHVGTFRSLRERREPVILTVGDGVRVGLVAGTYSLNGLPMPEGRPWAVSMWDADNLLRQARRAKAAGADVVVVHIHGGNEYDHLPNADQVALVERLTRSPDVDLVLGEHAHVVQPIARVHRKWVVYGMGNLIAHQELTRPATYQGIVVSFTFRERPDGSFEVVAPGYTPVAWDPYSAGRPMRLRIPGPGPIRDAIRDAVQGLGRHRLLAEH